MSNSLKNIVSDIQYRLNLSQEQIAERIGYSRPYLTKAIKAGADGKLLETIKREFPEIAQKNTFEEPEAEYFTKKIDANKAIGNLFEKGINITARLTVIEQMLEQLISLQTKKSIAVVSGERKKAVNMEANRLYDEQKRKG